MIGKLKLYAAATLAFMVGLIGIYWQGRRAGVDAVTAKTQKRRIEDIQAAQEVENEIDALGADELRYRASKWLRNDK